jgi:hypothetical protein
VAPSAESLLHDPAMALWKYAKQPSKGIFLTCQILFTLFARLPTWSVIGILAVGRQKRSWTYKRALSARFMRLILTVIYR